MTAVTRNSSFEQEKRSALKQDDSKEKPKVSENPWRAAGWVSAIGVDLAVCILLGYFGGAYLARLTGGKEVWVIVGVLTGVVAGIAGAVVMIKRLLEEPNE